MVTTEHGRTSYSMKLCMKLCKQLRLQYVSCIRPDIYQKLKIKELEIHMLIIEVLQINLCILYSLLTESAEQYGVKNKCGSMKKKRKKIEYFFIHKMYCKGLQLTNNIKKMSPFNPLTPVTAKCHLQILLCLTPNNFTRQWGSPQE